jgi:hypothetical protein
MNRGHDRQGPDCSDEKAVSPTAIRPRRRLAARKTMRSCALTIVAATLPPNAPAPGAPMPALLTCPPAKLNKAVKVYLNSILIGRPGLRNYCGDIERGKSRRTSAVKTKLYSQIRHSSFVQLAP